MLSSKLKIVAINNCLTLLLVFTVFSLIVYVIRGGTLSFLGSLFGLIILICCQLGRMCGLK